MKNKHNSEERKTKLQNNTNVLGEKVSKASKEGNIMNKRKKPLNTHNKKISSIESFRQKGSNKYGLNIDRDITLNQKAKHRSKLYREYDIDMYDTDIDEEIIVNGINIDDVEIDDIISMDEGNWALDENDRKTERLIKHALWMHSDELKEEGYNIQPKELTPEEKAVALRAYKKAMRAYKSRGVRNFNRSATKVAGVAAAVLVIVTTLSLTGVSRSSAGSFFSTVIKVFRDDVRINTDMNEPPPSIIPPPPNDYDEKQDNAWSEEVAYADFEEFVADNQGQELYELEYIPEGYSFTSVVSSKSSDNSIMEFVYSYLNANGYVVKLRFSTFKNTTRAVKMDMAENGVETLSINDNIVLIAANELGATALVKLSDVTRCTVMGQLEREEIINIIKGMKAITPDRYKK